MSFDQQKTIILLVTVLLAVVAGSVAVLLFLPGRDSSLELDPVDTTPVRQSNGFNLRIFDRSDFRSLDQRLIQENSLPVQPPTGLGKANPFL